MQRILIILAVALMASPAVAGRRCNRTVGYTLQNSYAWPKHGGCYSCHTAKKAVAKADDWRSDMTGIGGRLVDNADFEANFDKLIELRQRSRGTYVQSGGYSTIQGEYSSYPTQGQTLYTVGQQVKLPEDIRIQETLNRLLSIGEQQNLGVRQITTDVADITAVEAERRETFATKQLAMQANIAIANGNPPTPVAETFRFSATKSPTGQVIIQPEPTVSAQGQPSNNPGLLVLENRCASCHSGPNVQGKFDLAKLDQLSDSNWEDVLERISLPAEDPRAMPKSKTAEGFGPGQQLTRREIHDVEDLAWGQR